MPRDVAAERAVLGSILVDSNAILKAIEKIDENDFYKPAHKTIYQAMLSLHNKGAEIDIVTLHNELKKGDKIDAVGGASYITELSTELPSASSINSYIDIVKTKSTYRKIITTCTKTANDCYQENAPIKDIINETEGELYNTIATDTAHKIDHIAKIMPSAISAMEKQYNSKGAPTGVPTGFATLDRMTGGLQKSELVIIAARPSMGKTSLALNIAHNAAHRYGKSVMLFSLEMPKHAIVSRLLCSSGKVNIQRMRDGTADENDWSRIADAMSALNRTNIYIDDTPAISLAEIRSKCRRMIMSGRKLDMIIIDYMTLINTKGLTKSDNFNVQVSELSKGLKGLARELDLPVVTLSQLSRASEKRTDHRPILSDLRESGSIEQDADTVMFLYRPSYYCAEEEETEAELIIAKQRNGETGSVKLYWAGAFTLFTELSYK